MVVHSFFRLRTVSDAIVNEPEIKLYLIWLSILARRTANKGCEIFLPASDLQLLYFPFLSLATNVCFFSPSLEMKPGSDTAHLSVNFQLARLREQKVLSTFLIEDKI